MSVENTDIKQNPDAEKDMAGYWKDVAASQENGEGSLKIDASIFDNDDLTEDELRGNDGWISAAKVVYDMEYGDGAWDKEAVTEGYSPQKAKEELADWGIGYMGRFNYNMVNMASQVSDISSADKTPEQKTAFMYMLDAYDHKNISASGFGRALFNMAWDPTTYVGIGTLGVGTAGAQAAKVAIKETFKGGLKEGLKIALSEAGRETIKVAAKEGIEAVGKTRLTSSALFVGSTEGALYGGYDDKKRQDVYVASDRQAETNWNNVITTSATSAVLGGSLGHFAPEIIKGASGAVKTITNKLDKHFANIAKTAPIAESAADSVDDVVADSVTDLATDVNATASSANDDNYDIASNVIQFPKDASENPSISAAKTAENLSNPNYRKFGQGGAWTPFAGKGKKGKDVPLVVKEGEYIPKTEGGTPQTSNAASGGGNNGGAEATNARKMNPNNTPVYDSFPKFNPNQFDKSKLLHRLSPNPLNWITIKASRANCEGIVQPVIDYIDNSMAIKVMDSNGVETSITERILQLNKDVLNTHHNGKDPEAIIDAFANNSENKALLKSLSDNLGDLSQHIKDTYKTNAELNGHIHPETGRFIKGSDDTRWAYDLTNEQKLALKKSIDDLKSNIDDIAEGTNGENAIEMLDSLGRIDDTEEGFTFDDFYDSMSGLSKISHLAAESKVRETGEWIDGSGKAAKYLLKQSYRRINSGFYSTRFHTDAPIIFNSTTKNNTEKNWNDFLEGFGERDKDGNLVLNLGGDVELKGSFVQNLDTIYSGGFDDVALDSIKKLIRNRQSKLRKGTTNQPMPTSAKFLKAVEETPSIKMDPKKQEFFNKVAKVIEKAEVGVASASDLTWFKLVGKYNIPVPTFGLYERMFEVNRYTQSRLEANRYFWDNWEQFQSGRLPGKPALLQMSSAAAYYATKPFAYAAGSYSHSVGKSPVFGFDKKSYYGNTTWQWKKKITDGTEDGAKESFWNPLGRMATRVPSGFLLDGFTEKKWFFGKASIPKPSLLGKTAIGGGGLYLYGDLTDDEDLKETGGWLFDTATPPVQWMYGSIFGSEAQEGELEADKTNEDKKPLTLDDYINGGDTDNNNTDAPEEESTDDNGGWVDANAGDLTGAFKATIASYDGVIGDKFNNESLNLTPVTASVSYGNKDLVTIASKETPLVITIA